MVFIKKLSELFTTLTLYVTQCNLLIFVKVQITNIVANRSIIQKVLNVFKPKITKYSKSICGKIKNSGSPKESNFYLNTRGSKYNNFRKYLLYGDGASVVGIRYYSKGKQFFKATNLSTDQKDTSIENVATMVLDMRPIEISYKQLYDKSFLIEAYNKIKSNPGNMTEGVSKETLDGLSLSWLNDTIDKLKNRSFKFYPNKRISIPKTNGSTRILGIPSQRDKILQQAYKTILESVYEKIFLNSSHGFRPNRSTHTAIYEIKKWSDTTWIIEGDIKGYFDNIDHHLLCSLIKKEIKDTNLIDFYWKMVRAGYVSEGQYKRNNLGVPQGGIISPILSNIYLHEFDVYMESICREYSDEKRKSYNPEYEKLRKERKKYNPNEAKYKRISQKMNQISSVKNNPNRVIRIRYNRYADDWIVGITGPLTLVDEIREKIYSFFKTELKLTLNLDKIKISNLIKDKVHYLGFEICRHSIKWDLSRKIKIKSGPNKEISRKSTNQRIIINFPKTKIVNKLIEHGFASNIKKPTSITKWIYLSPWEIISKYNYVIRGLLNYYSMVDNKNLFNHVIWILKFSACFTLARKLNISPSKVFKKFGKNLTVPIEYEKSETNKKIKFIKFNSPINLKKNRSIKVFTKYDDPFKIKYFSIRSHSLR